MRVNHINQNHYENQKITIAFALLMGVVVAGLCSIRNSKESEFFNENLDALMDTEITVGNLCAYQPQSYCYYDDAFGSVTIKDGIFAW